MQACYGCEGDSRRGGCSAAHLRMCDMMIDRPPKSSANSPCPKVWKLRDPQRYSQFQEVIKAHLPAVETGVATTTEEEKKKAKVRNRYN